MAYPLVMLASLLAADPAVAPFEYPIFVTIGPDRTLYIADQNIPAVFKLTASGEVGALYKGEKRYRTPLYRPRGLAVAQNGDLIVCDPATYDVYRLRPDGKATPLTGRNVKLLDGRETTLGELIQPEGAAVSADGKVYVSDMKYQAIFAIGDDRKPVKVADVPAPRGVAFDTDGTLLVVSNSPAQLKRVDVQSGEVTDVVGARPFRFPMSVCVRPDGQYIVTDNYSKALWLVTREGKASKWVEGEPLQNPTGVACDAEGNLAIADPHQRKIYWLSPEKQFSVAAESK
jgi:DNA-binding beta-propeller fold protein YncE